MEEVRLFEKLWLFCFGKTMSILSLFINIKVLNHESFEDFLNRFKHDIIHKWIPTTPCCLCPKRAQISFNDRSVLVKPQIATMYEMNAQASPGHQTTNPRGYITQYCICNISALHDVVTDDIDIGTVHCLLKTCADSVFMRVKTHIEVIRTIRNYLAHSTNHKITNDDFNTKWEELEKAVLCIAAEIGPSHKLYEQKQIASLKSTDITTRELMKVFQTLDEHSKKLWEHMSTKIQKDEQNQQNILEELKGIRIDVNKLTFVLTCHHVFEKQNQQPRGWKCCMCFSFRGNRPISMMMKIDTPDSWKVEEMQQTLLRKSSQLLGFDLESVSIGSLIIVFKVQRHILEDYEQFKSCAELFFTTMVNVCKIDIDTPAEVQVNSTVIFNPYDKHSVPCGSVKVVDNKPIHTGSTDFGFIWPDEEFMIIKPFDIGINESFDINSPNHPKYTDSSSKENELEEVTKRHEDGSMTTVFEETDKSLTQRKNWRSSKAHSNALFYAAIDIGSTYSGYAFSSKDDYTKEPNKINSRVWTGTKLVSLKAPTAILLDSSQEFVAFGYEAEDQYSELVAADEHEDYYYFYRFKKLLFDMIIARQTIMNDELGKPVEVLRVFHLTIRYLKDQVFRSISDKIRGIHPDEDIHYVLTVPTKWHDSAVEITRVAATKAGIKNRCLSIVSEPEAALVFCQYLNEKGELKKYKNDFEYNVNSGMMFMVIDLGGESADITVLQRDIYSGILRKVIPPSSGDWGGTSVDDRFCMFLKTIFGNVVMERLKTKHDAFIDLFRAFETKKRSIRVDQNHKIVVSLPDALIDLVKCYKGEMETVLQQSPYGDSVNFRNKKIHISPETFRDLFKPTIDALVKHLGAMFRHVELRDLKTIFVVGAFAECDLIQCQIQAIFGGNTQIIIPEEAGMAVLKGAVLCGHSRISA